MILEKTKAQFRELIDSNKIDIRPDDVAYYNNEKFKIKVIDADNKVELTKE